jgi:hypothetical protein
MAIISSISTNIVAVVDILDVVSIVMEKRLGILEEEEEEPLTSSQSTPRDTSLDGNTRG